MTPLMVVMLAIGTTDVLFAMDSIPLFGLTQDPYIVFTARRAVAARWVCGSSTSSSADCSRSWST
ncbi:hypothetical protein SALBM135S_10049 [Streptomyces alboniger]